MLIDFKTAIAAASAYWKANSPTFAAVQEKCPDAACFIVARDHHRVHKITEALRAAGIDSAIRTEVMCDKTHLHLRGRTALMVFLDSSIEDQLSEDYTTMFATAQRMLMTTHSELWKNRRGMDVASLLMYIPSTDEELEFNVDLSTSKLVFVEGSYVRAFATVQVDGIEIQHMVYLDRETAARLKLKE